MTVIRTHAPASLPYGLVLIVLLFLAGGVVAYLGVQPPTPTLPGPVNGTAASESLPLPQEEPEIPLGPHRERFATKCVVCHSPRLIFNQPLLSETQWTAIVQKMADAYGADIPADEKKELVAYLISRQQRDNNQP